MIFSTLIFVFAFFPLFFLAYYLAPTRYKNIIILLGSLLFYFWGAPKFVFVVLLTMLFDWHLGKLIHNTNNQTEKKYYLALDIIINVSLLVYFKYANFFVENLYTFMETFQVGHPGKWVDIALPIGISFIVFEKITYCVDIYRKVTKPAERLTSYLVYVFLFPQLIAGPIIQYHEVARKIVKRSHNYYNFRYGLFRFSIGLVKKVWLADVVARVADSVFGMPTSQLPAAYAWLGLLSYALQIYFDFSGYADMAIGMMRMMGFKIGENFNMPYISQNITEFWRRWHMSLGRWMKSYLYIPLGGNRVSVARNYFNLVFVFLISGLWHGANWTFVLWGLYHGIFLLIDRLFWVKTSKRFPAWVNIVITFFVVNMGWVLFRADNLPHALAYMRSLFSLHTWAVFYPEQMLLLRPEVVWIFVIGLVLVFLPALPWFWKIVDKVKVSVKSKYALEIASLVLLMLAIFKIATAAFSPFIYFRF